jgi:hypothetical protein
MDWIGAGLNIVGLWLLPKSRMIAMYVYLVSSVMWIIYAAYHNIWSLILLQIVLLLLNIRTIVIWKKEAQQ